MSRRKARRHKLEVATSSDDEDSDPQTQVGAEEDLDGFVCKALSNKGIFTRPG